MSEWIKHDGKGCPVSIETMVYVRFGGGDTDEVLFDGNEAHPSTAGYWGGTHESSNWFWYGEKPSSNEIAEYRVVTP